MRIITVAAHTRFYENDSTFSVRAITFIAMAMSMRATYLVFGGRLSLVKTQIAIVYTVTQRALITIIMLPAVSVLPFAVWYGRGESVDSYKIS